ncbi:MAG: hypothetical protein MJZ69_02720 [Bacteroidaceae bacterium]|nr:hypothetical protein [Bacteroidaceae bacterium]
MKKIYNLFTLLLVALFGLSMTGCSNDDLNTNQFQNEVALNVYGPNPVVRGGTLRFIGSNLDQVDQIIIPGIGAVTNFEVVKSGIPSEIRVVIPKDGPIVGTVKLVTKTGKEIETQTQLTYTESIEFDSFSPESAMPGEVITIEGDYLNLIHMVEFTDGVLVGEDDFVEHDRYSIKVKVPEEARTGKIKLYDVDLTKADPADNDVSFNIIESEKALNVGTPTIASLASPRGDAEAQGTVEVKQGETITVKGNNFNLVAGVIAGGIEIKEFTNDGKTITFTVPAEAEDGEVVLVCKSGVEVPVGKIVTLIPSDLAVSPDPVKNGADLTITGKDLDVIVSVTFPNVADAVAVEATATAITVAVPEAAQEGYILLNMLNGKAVSVEYTLVKPTVTAYGANPASAGSELTIEGTDLDLVKTVAFVGNETPADITVAADGKSMTLTVPMDSQSGAVTLNLKNGATVTAQEINIEEAVFCYATVLPTPEDEIHAGATCTLTVKNVDVLTGVEINGVTCQYIVSGDNLIIGVPDNAKKGSKLRLISSNGEITYTVDFIPNTEQKIVLWKGMTELTWGDGGRVFLPKEAFDDVPAGAELVLCYTQKDGVWGQAQVNDGWWSKMPNLKDPEGTAITNGDGCLVPTDIYGWFSDGQLNRETSILLTEEVLAHIKSHIGDNGSMVIQGQELIFTQVYVRYTISLEVDIASFTVYEAEGRRDVYLTYPFYPSWGDGDTGKLRVIRSGLQEIGVKKGSKLFIYKEGTGQLQINNANWGSITTAADWSGDVNPIEVEFDDELMKCVTGEVRDSWSDYAFILQGDGLKITKMTILP